MKFCRKCSSDKDTKDFGNNKNNEDGLQPYCKLCSTEAVKACYRRNPEKHRADATRWNNENKERRHLIATKAAKKWAQANPEKVKEYQKKYNERKRNENT
jgi:hypothetical protein